MLSQIFPHRLNHSVHSSLQRKKFPAMFIPAFSWHLVCTKFLSSHTALVFFDGCHVPFYFFHVQAKKLLGSICLLYNAPYPILTSIVHADCLSPSSFQSLSPLQKGLNANSLFPCLPFLTFLALTHELTSFLPKKEKGDSEQRQSTENKSWSKTYREIPAHLLVLWYCIAHMVRIFTEFCN